MGYRNRVLTWTTFRWDGETRRGCAQALGHVWKGGNKGLNLNIDLMIDIAEQVVKREEELEKVGKPQNNKTHEAPYSSRRDEVLRDIWVARGSTPFLKLLEFGKETRDRLIDVG